MRPRYLPFQLLFLSILVVLSSPIALMAAEAPGPERSSFFALGDPSGWSADLVRPAGKTRWHIADATNSHPYTVTVVRDGGTVAVTRATQLGERRIEETRLYRDPSGGNAALAWALPGREKLLRRPGERVSLRLTEELDGRIDELDIQITGIGAGWVELPTGPHEVAVERAIVLRRAAGEDAFLPDEEIVRWLDPRYGLVAETRKPSAGAPTARSLVDDDPAASSASGTAPLFSATLTPDSNLGSGGQTAIVLAQTPEFHGTLLIFDDEIDTTTHSAIQYGWNRGDGVAISTLTPDAHATMGDLVAASSWDFSGDNSSNSPTETASTIVPLDATHTCNIGECGYTAPPSNRVLARQDEDHNDINADGTVNITNTVYEREVQAGKVVVWQRAGAQFEGKPGAFGGGESRLCFDPTTGRPEVAQWEFDSDGSGNFVMQAGDLWSTPFDCDQVFFNEVCGSPGLFPTIYADGCTVGASDVHVGEQRTDVLKEGVVTLPSGHNLNTLLVRIKSDNCVYGFSGCSNLFRLDHVRKYIYLWVAPHISTVVRLQSVNHVDDATSFTALEETDIKFGLFPPLSVGSIAVTDTSVTLSWNPGNDDHRIDRYKVYWDTDSGGASSYAFDSDSNPGQVSFDATLNEATISGLTPGTQYFLSVSSLVTHTDVLDPLDVTEYESLVFPVQVFGDPGFAYPTELIETTTGGACTPTQEVANLTASQLPNGDLQLCWDPSSDPCLGGYDILASNDATSDTFFSTFAHVGATTCWSGHPLKEFYLVVVHGSGGQGPWGHYGK